MHRAAALLMRATYLRYVGASVIALAVDLGLFLALQASGTPLVLVSAASYSAGIVAHWLVSSRLVFADELRAAGAERTRQQALFLLSALAGLAITVAIVGLAASVGVDPRLAKLIAIGVSFQATYLLRSKIVFA